MKIINGAIFRWRWLSFGRMKDKVSGNFNIEKEDTKMKKVNHVLKNTKKMVALLLTAVLLCTAAVAFASCAKTEKRTLAQKVSDGESLRIGVIQYLSHPSLDNCYAGVREALKQSGIKCEITYKVGSNTSAENDCSAFAQDMVTSGYDLVIAIATPAATLAYAATGDTEIPMIFCAVSDPVTAHFVKSMEVPGDLCTGTSDVLDLEAQVDLIQKMQPDLKSIGILYTSSEANSLTNLKNFRAICEKRGLQVNAKAVQNASDVPAAAEAVAAESDCINNFTDNNVVNNLNVVLEAADRHGIPVYGSEVEQVRNGCLAAVSIDYVALGRVTGQMAVEVMKGADCKTMAVKTITDATPVINQTVLEKLGMSMPVGYENAEIVTDRH